MLNDWTPVSLPISEEMVVYKDQDEKRPAIETTRTFASHGMHESSLHLPLHTGTHVDYPLHVIEGGKCSSDYDRFPVDFSVFVVDLCPSPPQSIGLPQMRDIPVDKVQAVFFRTIEQPLAEFDPVFHWVNNEAAAWLAAHPLLFAGTDQPGIERNQPGHPTHIQLLKQDILIIEGLDLSHIKGGIHQCAAFSLGIQGVEAEPILVYALAG